MNREEMAASFLLKYSIVYNRISKPMYFHEKGPYIIGMVTFTTPWTVHLYEFLDAEAFLTIPHELPDAYNDIDSFYSTLDSMNLSWYDMLTTDLRTNKRIIIPDTPECRQKVQNMYQTDHETAARVFLMTDSGGVFYSRDLLPKPL
jgi:hypothetical protein